MSAPRRKPGRPRKEEGRLTQVSVRLEAVLLEKVAEISLAYGVSTSKAVCICVEGFQLSTEAMAAVAAIKSVRQNVSEGGAA